MKRIITFLFTISTLLLLGQAPEAINYQAVVRDAGGALAASTSVSFKMSILKTTATGTAVYEETHIVMTNAYGQANFQIGKGMVLSGSMAAIDWAADPHFLKVELDITGGSSFVTMGTSELVSVPYALHAKTVEVDNVIDADADPANEIQMLTLMSDSLGITSGNMVDLSPYLDNTDAQMLSISNDTVFLTNGGFVVLPASGGGTGNTLDQAYDEGGPGQGRVISAQNGPVRINSTANKNLELIGSANAPALDILQSGAGEGIYLTQTGSDSGAEIYKTGTGTGVYIEHDGTGDALWVNQKGSGTALYTRNQSDSVGVWSWNQGDGVARYIRQDGDAVGLYTWQVGDEAGVYMRQEGKGRALWIDNFNDSIGVYINNDGKQRALFIESRDDGIAQHIQQDGDRAALWIDQKGLGTGLYINNEGDSVGQWINNFGDFWAQYIVQYADTHAVVVYQKGNGTGQWIYQEGDGVGLWIENYGDSIAQYIYNAGDERALVIKQDGDDYGAHIYQVGNEAALVVDQLSDSIGVWIDNQGDNIGVLINQIGDGPGNYIDQQGDGPGQVIWNEGDDDGLYMRSLADADDGIHIIHNGKGNAINIEHDMGHGIFLDNAGDSTTAMFIGNFNPMNDKPTIIATNMGEGSIAHFNSEDNNSNMSESVIIKNSGAGKGLVVGIDDEMSGKVNMNPAVEVVSNGLGSGINIMIINSETLGADKNTEPGIEVTHAGMGNAGLFKTINILDTLATVDILNSGKGNGLHIESSGTVSEVGTALHVEQSGASGVSTGGRTAHFDSQLASTSADAAVLITSNATSTSHTPLKVVPATSTMKAADFEGDVDIASDLTVGTSFFVPTATVAHLTVTTSITAPAKAFKIDHPLDPENKMLIHNSIESNERVNIYSGNVKTDADGFAIVTFPEYMSALNADFRYQLTVMDKSFARAVIWEEYNEELNQFVIRTDEPGIRVSWQLTGERIDQWSLDNPLNVEVDK